MHIAIYPYNDKESAHAFLLALRAKGYHPRVIVTDLRVDYGPLIAQVFPEAQHHQCIFHALQNVQGYFFTPFSQDAQPRIRGKCPLELAGYDISQVPMASLCAGLTVTWPLEVARNYVLNL